MLTCVPALLSLSLCSMCQVEGEEWVDLLQPYTASADLRLKYAGPNAGTFLDGTRRPILTYD